MQQIGTFTYTLQVKNKKTERGELLRYFTDVINKERVGTKYKPLTIKMIGIKLQLLSLEDLYYMQSVAKDIDSRGKSVGAYLFGSIKINGKTT